MSDYKGPERRIQPQGFGLACLRKEGGWNYDITRSGQERRKDHPNYENFWDWATSSQRKQAEEL